MASSKSLSIFTMSHTERQTDVIRVHPQAIANRVRIYPAENSHDLAVAVEKYKRHYSVVHADLAHLRVYVLED